MSVCSKFITVYV